MEIKKCLCCGREFPVTVDGKKYCSRKCSVKYRKRRKTLKTVAITATMVFVLMLGGCDFDETESGDKKLDANVYEWIDADTGVHYIYNQYGIQVRYNSDGTIMTEQGRE